MRSIWFGQKKNEVSIGLLDRKKLKKNLQKHFSYVHRYEFESLFGVNLRTKKKHERFFQLYEILIVTG